MAEQIKFRTKKDENVGTYYNELPKQNIPERREVNFPPDQVHLLSAFRNFVFVFYLIEFRLAFQTRAYKLTCTYLIVLLICLTVYIIQPIWYRLRSNCLDSRLNSLIHQRLMQNKCHKYNNAIKSCGYILRYLSTQRILNCSHFPSNQMHFINFDIM